MKITIFVAIAFLSSQAFGSLLPTIAPEPIIGKALQTMAHKHPEIKSSDLKFTQIDCVYAFNNDFDTRKPSIFSEDSKKGANAVVTFIVIPTRHDVSDTKQRVIEYDCWKVTVAEDARPEDMFVEKSKYIFTGSSLALTKAEQGAAANP